MALGGGFRTSPAAHSLKLTPSIETSPLSDTDTAPPLCTRAGSASRVSASEGRHGATANRGRPHIFGITARERHVLRRNVASLISVHRTAR